MLIAFNRRIPRTKSILERTSSRRYSSVDFGSNGFCDNQHERIAHDNTSNGHTRQNHLHFIDAILRQNDDVVVPSNGHDELAVPCDGDDNSDEYACFNFTSA